MQLLTLPSITCFGLCTNSSEGQSCCYERCLRETRSLILPTYELEL